MNEREKSELCVLCSLIALEAIGIGLSIINNIVGYYMTIIINYNIDSKFNLNNTIIASIIGSSIFGILVPLIIIIGPLWVYDINREVYDNSNKKIGVFFYYDSIMILFISIIPLMIIINIIILETGFAIMGYFSNNGNDDFYSKNYRLYSNNVAVISSLGGYFPYMFIITFLFIMRTIYLIVHAIMICIKFLQNKYFSKQEIKPDPKSTQNIETLENV